MIDPKNMLAILKYKVEETVFADAVDPGEYAIDFVCRIRGTMRKGADHTARISAAVPWQQLFAVAMSKLNGVTVESIVEEALKGNGRIAALAADAKERAQAAVDQLVGETERTVRGAVRVALEVEELPPGLTQAAFEALDTVRSAELAKRRATMDDLDPGERASVARARRGGCADA